MSRHLERAKELLRRLEIGPWSTDAICEIVAHLEAESAKRIAELEAQINRQRQEHSEIAHEAADMINDNESAEAMKVFREYFGVVNQFRCLECGRTDSRTCETGCPTCGADMEFCVGVQNDEDLAAAYAEKKAEKNACPDCAGMRTQIQYLRTQLDSGRMEIDALKAKLQAAREALTQIKIGYVTAETELTRKKMQQVAEEALAE